MFAGRVKIVSHSSCRASAILKYFCPLKGHNSGTNLRKITCYNPRLDLVNMNIYIKFGEILSFCSHDIERQ